MSGPLAFMLFGLFCFWLAALTSDRYYGAGTHLAFGMGVVSVGIGFGWFLAEVS